MRAWLEARLRIVDTGTPTVLSALILEAYATVLGTGNADLGAAQTAQGLADPVSVDSLDLDDVVANLSLVRKDAAKATGFVTFRRVSAPTAEIRIGNEDGSGAIIVGTGRDADGAFITFETTSTVFFTLGTQADPISGLYEVSAPIRALQPGTSGNRDAGDITDLLSAVGGVDSVTNKTAARGGKNEESNEELAARMISKILGFQPGIEEGLRTIALGQNGVEDSAVVGPDDSEFQRSPIGSVDLVVRGQAETAAIDQVTYQSPVQITLESRPVTDITSVISTVGVTQSALTEGLQWQFSQDLVSEERLSAQSNDHLSWVGPTTGLPNAGADVIITYTYDQLIRSVQDIVDLDTKHYPAARVLVKRATAVTVDVAISVKRNSTIDSTSLRNNISTVLTDLINDIEIGGEVQQSELISAIKDVSGVRTVSVPFSTLARRGSSGASDIQLTKYEYATVDDTSFSITITT